MRSGEPNKKRPKKKVQEVGIPETDVQKRNKVIATAREIIKIIETRYNEYSNRLLQQAQHLGQRAQGDADILKRKNRLVGDLGSFINEVEPGGSLIHVEHAQEDLEEFFQRAKVLSSWMRPSKWETSFPSVPERRLTNTSLEDLEGDDDKAGPVKI